MLALARPSTPTGKPAASRPSTPITGTWRHPRLDEIVRRRDASSFSERNVKRIKWNTVALLCLWVATKLLWNNIPSLFQSGGSFQQYSGYIYHFFQTVLIFNLFVAFLPLVRAKDEITDIPLTPAQRKLFGLAPSSVPPTPGSSYSTPPRYARTPTSLSGSPGGRELYSDSPLWKKGSPNAGSMPGSPFSPGPSPLLQKAIGGGMDSSRRHSYGSPSPLGPGAPRMNLPETPGTPSPMASKGVNVGLNNKWLYDKGRRNSGSSKLFS